MIVMSNKWILMERAGSDGEPLLSKPLPTPIIMKQCPKVDFSRFLTYLGAGRILFAYY
jgi:hypothetical protein